MPYFIYTGSLKELGLTIWLDWLASKPQEPSCSLLSRIIKGINDSKYMPEWQSMDTEENKSQHSYGHGWLQADTVQPTPRRLILPPTHPQSSPAACPPKGLTLMQPVYSSREGFFSLQSNGFPYLPNQAVSYEPTINKTRKKTIRRSWSSSQIPNPVLLKAGWKKTHW